MKTKLAIIIAFISLCTSSYSQTDLQWLIWNGKGKNKLTAAGNLNNYEFSIGTSSKFNMQAVSLPDLNKSPRGRNDVFIIYANGEHFNSRYLNPGTPGFFYNAADAQNHVMTHNFVVSTGMQVNYLYLTNRYEGDDPPEKVMVPQGYASVITTSYPIDKTYPNILSSDHDIVLGKDITIIINYDSLDIDPSTGSITNYALTFNGVQAIGSTTLVTDNDVLRPEPAFSTGGNVYSSLPSSTIRTGGAPAGTVMLTPSHEHFGYINFKPTQQAYQRYGPDANGEPRYKAVFAITKNGQAVRSIQEALRASHDPNFLRVDSVCQATDQSYTVFYHLEFENVSETSANNLKAQVTFPDMFDIRCFKDLNWFAGGAACTGRVHFTSRTVTFEFLGNQAISRCPEEFTDVCKGYVNFRIKVSSGHPLISPETSLKLTDPTVFFDDKPFPLERFFDALEYKGFDRIRTIHIGNCEFCSPGPCIPCILAGIAAVIIASLLFAWRRRRRT
ncbi:MAG: hypothetical protein ABJC12_03550 [Saprospiraceae bacterium]